MLTGQDIEDFQISEEENQRWSQKKLINVLVVGKPETYSWVIEKTLKDGTTSYEFPSGLTEQQARDKADAILGNTPGVDTVSIYRKVGQVKRVSSTIWE